MDNFQYYSPTEFVFGRDCETKAGELVKKYGGSRVLIHYGGGSAVKSGLLDRVKESLEAAGLAYTFLGGVKPNPRDTLVYTGIALCKQEDIDFVLCVGGGSVIDSGKAIAIGACYEGDFWDFYCGKAVIQKALPVGTILTIAAAGSEGSWGTVITRESTGLKRSAKSDLLRPRFSIMNPELTCSLPPYQTACGIADIMAHVFERYFTNTREVEITDRLCEGILCTMVKEAPRVMKDPSNYEARANIMWSGTLAHSNICGVGRSQDWNSHSLGHELSGLYDVAHGASLAVMMPAWMEYVMHHNPMRFAQMANRVFGCAMDFEKPEETAKQGIQCFRRFLKELGLPTNFAELGAKEEDIPLLVEKMGIGDGRTGGFVPLSSEDAAAIYRIAAKASV